MRLGLLGTRFTMEGRFYPEVFARRGIEVFSPSPEDVVLVHQKYIQELVPGEFLPETPRQLVSVIGRLKQTGAQGVLLAGTELPLFDTTRIHVRRAVAELLS